MADEGAGSVIGAETIEEGAARITTGSGEMLVMAETLATDETEATAGIEVKVDSAEAEVRPSKSSRVTP